jgi:hypothetical protein
MIAMINTKISMKTNTKKIVMTTNTNKINTIVEQVVSDGSDIINLIKITPGSYSFTNPTTKITKTLPHDVEVFVGGYAVNSEWAPGVEYNIGAIVTIGSYTYRCITAHTSAISFYSDISNWSFFIGNIRLKKDSYQVHNVTEHSESPEGDIDFDAEFTVDGLTKQIQLTTPVAFGTQVTVIKRSLIPWDGKYNTINIRLDDNKIAGFLRATPGIWYTGQTKYGNTISNVDRSFDSTNATFDNGTTTFDRG